MLVSILYYWFQWIFKLLQNLVVDFSKDFHQALPRVESTNETQGTEVRLLGTPKSRSCYLQYRNRGLVSTN